MDCKEICHCGEFSNMFDFDEISLFVNTLTVYYLQDDELTEQENEQNENEVYNFCFDSFIDSIV